MIVTLKLEQSGADYSAFHPVLKCMASTAINWPDLLQRRVWQRRQHFTLHLACEEELVEAPLDKGTTRQQN